MGFSMKMGVASIGMIAWLVGSTLPALAETVATTDVVTPLVATPLTSPNPVLGSDNLVHLAYEFTLMNLAPGTVTIEKVETPPERSDTVREPSAASPASHPVFVDR